MPLQSLRVQGFKSIKDATLQLGNLTVLIGANGAGKSNWISVFGFLREIVEQRLQKYVSTRGATTLLHFGPKVTEVIEIEVVFVDDTNANHYRVRLQPTDGGGLVLTDWATYHNRQTYEGPMSPQRISANAQESELESVASGIKRYALDYLKSYRIYHFHDTSRTAAVKQTQDLHDNRALVADAGNLAPFLYWMQQKHPDHFHAIEGVVRAIAPFFECFELEPLGLNEEKIRLEWGECGSDQIFGPHQFSDGTLRFMCLATLLLQPYPPSMIVLDEPELGLHPAAIQHLAGLLYEAAQRTQVLVATQSVTLLNQLAPEDVQVVERDQQGASTIRRLGDQDLSQWLNDYALGELWEKNVLGGRP